MLAKKNIANKENERVRLKKRFNLGRALSNIG